MDKIKENITNIKEKLILRIREEYEEKEANELISHISLMEDEEFIEFLQQQGLIQENKEDPKCLFCSMVFGDIPTTKIGENESAIAILEINPISKGHSLIIPKNHLTSSEEITEEIKELAREIAQKINKNFATKKVEFSSSNIMGHEFINVLPVYSNESFDSLRNKKSPEELFQIKKELEDLPKEEKIELKEEHFELKKRPRIP